MSVLSIALRSSLLVAWSKTAISIELWLYPAAWTGGTPMADQQSPTFQPPGGGSTFDSMIEARVATLQADVRHIRDSVGEIKLDLREVRSDLKQL